MADISFFDPRAEKENARRRKQAELLLEKGNAPVRNEQAGGMTVLRSPWENINQAAQRFVGERDLASADESDAELENARQGRIAEALKQWGTNPQGAADILAQDPRTSDMAAKILMGQQDREWQREKLAAEERMFGQRLASSQSTPATIQIANEIRDALAAGDYSRANLLRQIHKADDKGMNYYGSSPIAPFNPNTSIPQGFSSDFMPPPIQEGVPNPNNPYDQPDPYSPPPSAPVNIYDAPPPIPSPAPVAGYGDAVADIAEKKKAAEGRASDNGKRQGENENLYRSVVSRMPQLEGTVEKLSKLGQVATYTNAGQLKNFAARELGMNIPDAAVARAEYVSMVDNEILPLLRDTFGAQFTQKEGESLRATLGNPDVSPREKDAVLRSFLRTKMETIESMRREMDYGQSIPEYTPRTVEIGGQQYNPMGSPPPASGVQSDVASRLAAAGYSPEEIQEYLANRGL